MHSPKTIWPVIRKEAQAAAEAEPLLGSFLHATILNHETFQNALAFHLADKLGSPTMPSLLLMDLMGQALVADSAIADAACADIVAVDSRDPACRGCAIPLLYFKGFHAIQAYRISHWFWTQGREVLAISLQSRISEVFAVDIHPAARFGKGIMLDHATGLVVGETAVIGDCVSLLHGVTLGGTGKECGDRHPKISCGVLIGARATILGNIRIGEGAKIGAGSVVLQDVPPHCTAAGVPARVVGRPSAEQPALDMNQCFPCPQQNAGAFI
jgi:serine O-acetyltransferase